MLPLGALLALAAPVRAPARAPIVPVKKPALGVINFSALCAATPNGPSAVKVDWNASLTAASIPPSSSDALPLPPLPDDDAAEPPAGAGVPAGGLAAGPLAAVGLVAAC